MSNSNSKSKAIKKILSEYHSKIDHLKSRKKTVLMDLLKRVDGRKIEKIRNKLNSI